MAIFSSSLIVVGRRIGIGGFGHVLANAYLCYGFPMIGTARFFLLITAALLVFPVCATGNPATSGSTADTAAPAAQAQDAAGRCAHHSGREG